MKTLALPSMLGLSLCLHTSPAQAIPETWVASNGAGVTCTRAAPCASFAQAQIATDPGGVIKCVDAANFGDVIISKSLTIDCTGTAAGTVSTFIGVSVNTPGVVVTLRGLSIDGVGTGSSGVVVGSGSALHIENCRISGFHGGGFGYGIRFVPTAGTAKLHVSDSVISNNGLAASGGGIIIQPSGSASARVVLTRVQVENNTHGILADSTGTTGSIVVQVDGSMVAGSLGNGIWAKEAGVVVDRSSSKSNAGYGILADGPGALIVLGNSSVIGNGGGLGATGGGSIQSYQNNQTKGNGFDGAPTAVLSLN